MRCCNLWTRLRVSYAALLDPGLSGFIGILPDSTAGLLRFKCVLTLIVVLMMGSALKPDYVGRGCHSWYQSRTKRTPDSATRFQKFYLKLSHTITLENTLVR